jgi:HSP20 family protein
MALRIRNGFSPLVHLRDEMDRLAHDFFGPTASAAPARWGWHVQGFPALNVWEDGEALYAEAEVPGLKAEDLDISVVGADLTLRGRRGESAREGVTYHRQERAGGEFNRVLRLPVEVDAAAVEATLSDGVLLVKLPKAAAAKPKKIKVSPTE